MTDSDDIFLQPANFGPHAQFLSQRPDRICFYAVSDFGNVTSEVKDTAGAMNRYALQHGSPDFIVGLGDNFYPYGPDSADSHVFDEVWRNQFIRPYPALQVPWRMVLGNHDYYGNGRAQVDYHYHSRNSDRLWCMPDTFYSFTLTANSSTPSNESVSADFFVMDTNGVETDLMSFIPDLVPSLFNQKALLEQCLQKSTATWKIAFAHHPMYTAGAGHGRAGKRLRTSDEFRDYQNNRHSGFGLEEVCIQQQLDGFYAGHEHVFQAHIHGGVHHYCCGASGAEIRAGDGFYCGKDRESNIDWIAKPHEYGFVAVELTANTMTTKFISYDGTLIKEYIRQKP